MLATVSFQLWGLAFAVIMIGSCHSFQMSLCEVQIQVQVPFCHVPGTQCTQHLPSHWGDTASV